ncbi:hypothetical protein GCM10010378_13520 [Streptomyces viridochromogenes]
MVTARMAQRGLLRRTGATGRAPPRDGCGLRCGEPEVRRGGVGMKGYLRWGRAPGGRTWDP